MFCLHKYWVIKVCLICLIFQHAHSFSPHGLAQILSFSQPAGGTGPLDQSSGVSWGVFRFMAGESGQCTIVNICVLVKTDVWNQLEIKLLMSLFCIYYKDNSAGGRDCRETRLIVPPGAGIALVTDSSVVNNSSGSGCLKVRRSSVWAPSRGGTIIKYSSALPIHSQNTRSPTKHTQILIFSQSLLLLCLVHLVYFEYVQGVCVLHLRS